MSIQIKQFTNTLHNLSRLKSTAARCTANHLGHGAINDVMPIKSNVNDILTDKLSMDMVPSVYTPCSSESETKQQKYFLRTMMRKITGKTYL